MSIGLLGKSISGPVRKVRYALTKRRRVSPRPQTATISGGHPNCGRPPVAFSGRQFGCQHRNAPCLPAHCGPIGDRYAMSHRHAPLTHQTEREVSRKRPETHARPDGQGADLQGQQPYSPAEPVRRPPDRNCCAGVARGSDPGGEDKRNHRCQQAHCGRDWSDPLQSATGLPAQSLRAGRDGRQARPIDVSVQS